MPQGTLSSAGFILSREPTAGGYERLGVLSKENGYLRVMRRPSSKIGSGSAPDLFDLCAVTLEARQGGAWFLREYEVLKRFSGIGGRYEALEAASMWAGLASANAPELESCAVLFDITAKLLGAIDQGASSHAALLKALYLFARSEGLPVREDWLVNLPALQRKTAEEVLHLPLDEVAASAVSNAFAEEQAALCGNMILWMCRNHNIVPPAHP
jgi:hypothetical protein